MTDFPLIYRAILDYQDVDRVQVSDGLIIYLSKDYIKNFESLLFKNQIKINKIICANYAKSLLDVEFDELSVAGMKVISTSNLNEVHILPKEVTKPGYFERLFNIFS